VPLYDLREGVADANRIKSPPVFYSARGYTQRFFGDWLGDRALICLSDWQFEVETQAHFWQQAGQLIEDTLTEEQMWEGPVILIAGDMASCDNSVRGVASDAAPDFYWLVDWMRTKCGEGAELYFFYGNHDDISETHLAMRNASTFCLLPQGGVLDTERGRVERTEAQRQREEGAVHRRLQEKKKPGEVQASSKKPVAVPKRDVQEKQWRDQNRDQARLCKEFGERIYAETEASSPPAARNAGSSLLIASVHGIPALHTQGLKKVAREDYFRYLERVSGSASPNVLLMHSNPCLPGQERTVRGEDPK